MLAFCRSYSVTGAHRFAFVSTLNKIHDALLSGPGALPPCGSAFWTLSSLIVTINTPYNSSPEPKGFGQDDVKEEPGSQVFWGAARLSSESLFLWSCRPLLSYHCFPSTSGSPLCQTRFYASSAEYKEQSKGKLAPRVWEKRDGREARRMRPPLRRALSPVTELHSEHGGKKLKDKTSSGDTRKQRGDSSGRKHSRRTIRHPIQRKSSPFAGRFRFDNRLSDDGLDLSTKRKRIKPCPRDITFKRGLDADNSLHEAVDVGTKYAGQDLSPSSNAQFRQIQPARDLLAHIEENFLGRRRLSEWRRGGYDPKRTAPLDDYPESKTSGNPIQQTVFKRHKLTFVAAATRAASLPPLVCPEVALAGRSNVGKSSLINALTRRWGTARTSEKPGLTQSINFFTLGSQLCLVDLPGYGFAYAKAEKKEKWEELVKHYVQTRANLKRVILLLDAKWGMKFRDEELIYIMESAGVRYQIVMTKTDVLPPMDLARRTTQILQKFENQRFLVRPLMMVSSKTGAGLHLLRESLARLAANESRVNPERSI